MKKVITIITIAIFTVAFATQAQAQKIAHANMQEIMLDMKEYEDALKFMTEKQEDIRKQLLAQQKYIAEKDSALQIAKERGDSPEIIALKEAELQEIAAKYQQFAQSKQTELQNLELKLIEPIQKKLTDAIDKVAKANGYTYVLARAAILSVGSGATDISDLVRKELGITTTAEK